MAADHCMNFKHPFTICALSVVLAGPGKGQDIKFSVPTQPATQDPSAAPAPDQAPDATAATPSPSGFTEDQKAEEFGWFVSQKVGIAQWGFTPEQAEAIGRGVIEALEGRDSPYDIQKIGPDMDQFTRTKQAAYYANLKRRSLAADEALFAKLKDDKTVVETPSGLRYKILQPGSSSSPGASDTVTVNYEGRLVDGTVFDSSASHGKPLQIALGQTIPGWVEGLQKIGKGGQILLFIPPDLAYGDTPKGPIPPGSALVFKIELVDFAPGAPAAAGK
jgi:FKBP-type peptidyl-prolyl cis-trans isomerase